MSVLTTIKNATISTLSVAREEDLKKQEEKLSRIRREIKRNQWKGGLKRGR